MGGWVLWAALIAMLAVPTQEFLVLAPGFPSWRVGGTPLVRKCNDLAVSHGGLRVPLGSQGGRPLGLLRASASGNAISDGDNMQDPSDGPVNEADPGPDSEESLMDRVAAAVQGGGGLSLVPRGGEDKRMPRGTLAALCLVPPDEVRRKIEKMRTQLNRDAPRWAPQVPLLFFFLRPEQVNSKGLQEAAELIERSMKDFPPFSVTMDDISVQLHRNEWAAWVFPSNASQIRMLHSALSEIFPRYGEIMPTGVDYLPHISLGQWSSRSDAMEAMEKARPSFNPLSWTVGSVAIMTSPGGGTPFSVWQEMELKGPAPEDWEGLMPAKQMFWDLYQQKKEVLTAIRMLVKVQGGFERSERQIVGPLSKLTVFNEALESNATVDVEEGGEEEGSFQEAMAELSSSSDDSEAEAEDRSGAEDEDEVDDDGEEELLQEGDDEGVLLNFEGGNDGKTRSRGWTSGGARGQAVDDVSKGKFLELTRKVLEDLQATSMWGAEGLVTGTIDLDDLASPLRGKEDKQGGQEVGRSRRAGQQREGEGKRAATAQQQQQRQSPDDKGQSGSARVKQQQKGAKGRNGKAVQVANKDTQSDAKDMTHILLVRHGQSTWNAEGRWQGQADMPLSGMGMAQSALAAIRLGNATNVAGSGPFPQLHAIYSSPMERANTTAQIISRQNGMGPVVLDARVRERSVGEWSGMTYEEVQQKWPGYLKRRMLPPSYETDDMVLPRVFLALDNIRKKHPGENVALVCHAGIIYAVEAYLKAQAGYKNPTRRYRIGNLGCRWIKWDGSSFKLGKRVSLLASEGNYGTPKSEGAGEGGASRSAGGERRVGGGGRKESSVN